MSQQKVVITTAQKLTASQKRTVLAALRRKIGPDFQLEELVNPQVVGGLKIAVGQKEFDITITGQLAKLQSQLLLTTITTAIPLSLKQKRKIKQAIERSRGPINFRTVVDKRVIGGIKIRIGSVEFDATLLAKLKKIKKLLATQF